MMEKEREGKEGGEGAVGEAEELEAEHVHKVYDIIASHFSATRYKAWPLVEKFLKSLPCGSLVADVGCGNGKYLHLNPQAYFIGSDRSGQLIGICRERGFECMVSDGLKLPYRSNTFDYAISIAVIHHMANEKRRYKVLKELARILRVGGKMLVTVWAMEQKDKKKNYTTQDVYIPWHLKQPAQTKKESGAANEKRQEARRKRAERKRQQRGQSETPAASPSPTSSSSSSSAHASNSEEGLTTTEHTKTKGEQDATEPSTSSATITPRETDDETKGEEGSDQAQQSDPKEVVYQRYYHLFREGELEELVRAVPSLRIEERAFDHYNWYIIARKVDNEGAVAT